MSESVNKSETVPKKPLTCVAFDDVDFSVQVAIENRIYTVVVSSERGVYHKPCFRYRPPENEKEIRLLTEFNEELAELLNRSPTNECCENCNEYFRRIGLINDKITATDQAVQAGCVPSK